jgi:hypothetical protein
MVKIIIAIRDVDKKNVTTKHAILYDILVFLFFFLHINPFFVFTTNEYQQVKHTKASASMLD